MGRKFFVTLISFLLLLQLGACAQKRRDSSIIQDQSCLPPCWMNIQPGVSTREEVGQILQGIPWIDPETIKSRKSGGDSVRWSGTRDSGDSYGEIYFSKNLVALIKIYPSEKQGIQVSDVITKFGEPESVLIFLNYTEPTLKYYITVFLLYPSKGVAVERYYSIARNKHRNIEIKSDDEVTGVWYLSPSDLFSFFTNGIVYDLPSKKLDENIQDWYGYGVYHYFLWPLPPK